MDGNERGVARSQVGGSGPGLFPVVACLLGKLANPPASLTKSTGYSFFFSCVRGGCCLAGLWGLPQFCVNGRRNILWCEMQSRRKELGKQGLEPFLRCRMRIVFQSVRLPPPPACLLGAWPETPWISLVVSGVGSGSGTGASVPLRNLCLLCSGLLFRPENFVPSVTRLVRATQKSASSVVVCMCNCACTCGFS
jgi:hypothetical protein